MTFKQAIGKQSSHINFSLFEVPVHEELVSPIKQLINDANNQGFDFRLASGYRDFDRQLWIWNSKASGEKPVLNAAGLPVDISTLNDEQLLFSILRWSALPGTSRHHWGTDIDVFDGSQIDANYQVQLTIAETCDGGPFALLHCWLDEYLGKAGSDFFRPYNRDVGGVAPEPWHLSFRPLANRFAREISKAKIESLIQQTEIELKSAILANLDRIFEKYIVN